MDVADRLLTSLSENGIIDVTGGDGIVLTDEFRQAVSNTRERVARLPRSDLAEEFDTGLGEPEMGPIFDLATDYPDFVAYFLETTTRVEGLTLEEYVKTTATVQQLDGALPPSDGTPDGFFQVAGQQLEPLLQLNEKAVVYIWREDCDPCDLVREDLEAVLEDTPGDIALLSVYGPDCAKHLHEAYGVVGAPTVLFVRQGDVDARLRRARPRVVYEAEIRYLRER